MGIGVGVGAAVGIGVGVGAAVGIGVGVGVGAGDDVAWGVGVPAGGGAVGPGFEGRVAVVGEETGLAVDPSAGFWDAGVWLAVGAPGAGVDTAGMGVMALAVSTGTPVATGPVRAATGCGCWPSFTADPRVSRTAPPAPPTRMRLAMLTATARRYRLNMSSLPPRPPRRARRHVVLLGAVAAWVAGTRSSVDRTDGRPPDYGLTG